MSASSCGDTLAAADLGPARADDELEIEDFAWDDDKQASRPLAAVCLPSLTRWSQVFHFPCPCGDRFEISRAQLGKGEEVATCPSCSLLVRVGQSAPASLLERRGSCYPTRQSTTWCGFLSTSGEQTDD